MPHENDLDRPEDHDLTANFELHGKFWQAHEDESKGIPGIIRYTPEHGPELYLFGSFAERHFRHPAKPIPPNLTTIHGLVYSVAGSTIMASLLDVIDTNEPADVNVNKERMEYEIYYVNRVVLGAHVPTFNDIRIKALEVSYEDFDGFVDIHPLKPAGAIIKDAHGVVYTQTPPVEFKHLAGSNFRFSITDATVGRSSDRGREYAISYRHVLNIDSDVPIPLADGLGVLFEVRDFLRLCSMRSVVVQRVRLQNGDHIDGAWQSRVRSRRSRRRGMNWIINRRDIGDDRLEEVLGKFFALVNRLGFMAKLFFTELDLPSEIVDARFFHFAGCLEAFHRSMITQSDMHYVERLRELFSTLEPDTQVMLVFEPDRFLEAVKNTRNMLAHVNDGKAHEKFEGHQFLYANQMMQAWIVIMMLKNCGIAESLIRERMKLVGYSWGPFKF